MSVVMRDHPSRRDFGHVVEEAGAWPHVSRGEGKNTLVTIPQRSSIGGGAQLLVESGFEAIIDDLVPLLDLVGKHPGGS